jgi:hypothetical protein
MASAKDIEVKLRYSLVPILCACDHTHGGGLGACNALVSGESLDLRALVCSCLHFVPKGLVIPEAPPRRPEGVRPEWAYGGQP